MDRRKFLRRITVGAAVVVATPVLLADIGKQRILIHQGNCGPIRVIPYKLVIHKEYVKMPMTYDDFQEMVEYLRKSHDSKFQEFQRFDIY